MVNKQIIVAAVLSVVIIITTGLLSCISSNNSNSTDYNKLINYTDNNYTDNNTNSFSKYPKCPENLSGLLTVFFLDINQTTAVEPLGAVNGLGHNLPVDHNYFSSNVGAKPISPILPIYAPANITITRISLYQNVLANGTPKGDSEYMLDFVVCDEVTLWMEGVNKLSPALEEIFNNSNKTYGEGPLTQEGKSTNYMLDLSFKTKAGEIIGWTGGTSQSGSIAVSAFNENIKLRDDVNYSYYPGRLKNAFCFVDLYSGDLKSSIESKLGFYKMDNVGYNDVASDTIPAFIPRTKEPICGDVIQNIPGTIQGDWFYGKPPADTNGGVNLESQGKTLSFIHKNIDPSKGIVSISGTFMNMGAMEYIPNHSGFINREPSEVRADGNTYCYEPQDNLWFTVGGKILVQLIDDHTLKVEHKEGSCNDNESFITPFVYER